MKNAEKRVFSCKIVADTAENEQHFAEILPKTGIYPTGLRELPRLPAGLAGRGPHVPVRGRRHGPLGVRERPRPSHVSLSPKKANFAKFCKFLVGSFSAVSKQKFARKYAFDSSFHDLQDVHTFAPLQS